MDSFGGTIGSDERTRETKRARGLRSARSTRSAQPVRHAELVARDRVDWDAHISDAPVGQMTRASDELAIRESHHAITTQQAHRVVN